MQPPTRYQHWPEPGTSPQPAWRQESEEAAWRDHAGARPRGRRARHAPARTRAGTIVRGLTAALATGLLVLALVLVGVQYWATSSGQAGPGANMVIGHFVGALVALVLQGVADRRRDAVGAVATAATFAVVLGSIWYWWWL